MSQPVSAVVDRLRQLIVSGEIRQGERLLEVTTAARLGMSRTPLRPALAALAQEGLLEPNGARGYVVRAVTAQDVMDAFLVRANLEGLACSIVAQKGLSPEADARMRALLKEGDALLADGACEARDQAFRSMNEAFHMLILTETHNRCLTDLTARAFARPLLSGRVVHFQDPALLAGSHVDHWRIYRAIRQTEIDRARSIMQEHVLRSRDIVGAQIGDGLFAQPA